MRTQRRAAERGTSGRTSSPSERSWVIVTRDGTLPSSANDTWIPRAASSEATSGARLLGTRTITPTSRCLVFTFVSGCTCRILIASAATSSVDPIHVAAPRSSAIWVAMATARSRQRGIGRTRRGACSTTSAAAGSRSPAESLAGVGCGSFSDAKLASTCRRSSCVSLASRTRSRAAIARVFTRA